MRYLVRHPVPQRVSDAAQRARNLFRQERSACLIAFHGSRRSKYAISAEQWRDDVRLSDLEGKFVHAACSKRGADAQRRHQLQWSVAVRVML